MKTFEYCLYPTRCRHLFQQCLLEIQQVYNAMLEHAQTQHKHTPTFPTTYGLDQAFAGTAGQYIPATTRYTIADQLVKALTFIIC